VRKIAVIATRRVLFQRAPFSRKESKEIYEKDPDGRPRRMKIRRSIPGKVGLFTRELFSVSNKISKGEGRVTSADGEAERLDQKGGILKAGKKNGTLIAKTL